jgi:hypothetical protein
MDTAPQPQPCSKCGQTDSKAISQSDIYPIGKDEGSEEPIGTAYVFQCACGLAWTQSVKNAAAKQV